MKNNKIIGVFVGKFLPPHIGHTTQIQKCLNDCDILYVVIADSKKRTKKICKEANIKLISLNKRLKWLKKYFKNEKKIKFLKLNQGMLEAFPSNLSKWKIKFSKVTKNKINIWFVDNNYLEISKKYFPEYNFIGFNRNEINISATLIREDICDNIQYIIPEAKEFFINQINKK